jgi:DNA repair exonuclease SbcCD ATPase subunit
MFNIKISTPTYKANSWQQLDKQGELQISSEVDSLSDGYLALKVQVKELLTQANAENEIVVSLQQLGEKIERREATLRTLDDKIQTARTQLQRLEKFLKRLGINPAGYSLDISNHALESATDGETEESVAAEAEVDPIPFDSAGSGNYPHEF